MTAQDLLHILRGSKEYEFNGTVLTITPYYGGESVKLDLSLINEEMLETLIVEDDDEEDGW